MSLDARARIETAVGVLMELCGWEPNKARSRLISAADRAGRTGRDSRGSHPGLRPRASPALTNGERSRVQRAAPGRVKPEPLAFWSPLRREPGPLVPVAGRLRAARTTRSLPVVGSAALHQPPATGLSKVHPTLTGGDLHQPRRTQRRHPLDEAFLHHDVQGRHQVPPIRSRTLIGHALRDDCATFVEHPQDNELYALLQAHLFHDSHRRDRTGRRCCACVQSATASPGRARSDGATLDRRPGLRFDRAPKQPTACSTGCRCLPAAARRLSPI